MNSNSTLISMLNMMLDKGEINATDYYNMMCSYNSTPAKEFVKDNNMCM